MSRSDHPDDVRTSDVNGDGEVQRTLSTTPSGKKFVSRYKEWLEHLPEIDLEYPGDSVIRLEAEGVLGKGGMGVVNIARQASFGRRVAVKRLRRRSDSIERKAKLVSEAWTLGHLSHPNIVPIHVVGRAVDGSPVLVMKRIEGVPWRKLIRARPAFRDSKHGERALDEHLDVLLAVCDAVIFAHGQGVLHRDVKPSNVMVGEFGEVYLLDWGVAVRFADRGPDQIPHLDDTPGIAGTAAYLAPEMAHADRSRIAPTSDVFLLGACLHEVLLGVPPHVGKTLVEVLTKAREWSGPSTPPRVSAELSAILRRALAPRPEDRFETVSEFRQAIVAFRQHAASRTATDEARSTLRQLEDACADDDRSDEQAARVASLFRDCRHGFGYALELWPSNPAASERLQRAYELIAEFEIDRGAFDTAATYLDEMPRERPDLDKRLLELGARLAAEQADVARLAQRRQAEDPVEGSQSRSVFAISVGTAWSMLLSLQGLGAQTDLWAADLVSLAITVGLGAVASVLLFLFTSRELAANVYDQRVFAGLGIMVVLVLSVMVVGFRIGLPFPRTLGVGAMILGAVSLYMSILVDRPFSWMAGSFLVAALAITAVPGYATVIMAAAILVGSWGLARRWALVAQGAS